MRPNRQLLYYMPFKAICCNWLRGEERPTDSTVRLTIQSRFRIPQRLESFDHKCIRTRMSECNHVTAPIESINVKGSHQPIRHYSLHALTGLSAESGD